MIKKLNLQVVVMSLSALGLSAQVIMSPGDRTNVLDGMQSVLENRERPSSQINQEASPFHLTIKKAPEAPVEGPAKEFVPVNPDEPVTVLADATALEIVSRQFKPLGSMVLGSRGFLQLPGGKTIEKGQKFSAQIRGVTYDIMIREVTSKGYTLALGSAEIDQSFNKAGAAQ